MAINRRNFLGASAAAGITAPTVLKAAENKTYRLRMATSFPAGAWRWRCRAWNWEPSISRNA